MYVNKTLFLAFITVILVCPATLFAQCTGQDTACNKDGCSGICVNGECITCENSEDNCLAKCGSRVGDQCYYEVLEDGSSCDSEKGKCCAGSCEEDEGVCCHGSFCDSLSGQECCGERCIDALEGTCCNGSLCPSPRECCGTTCCGEGATCCNNECCTGTCENGVCNLGSLECSNNFNSQCDVATGRVGTGSGRCCPSDSTFDSKTLPPPVSCVAVPQTCPANTECVTYSTLGGCCVKNVKDGETCTVLGIEGKCECTEHFQGSSYLNNCKSASCVTPTPTKTPSPSPSASPTTSGTSTPTKTPTKSPTPRPSTPSTPKPSTTLTPVPTPQS